jgi:hypothetical protein
VKRRPTGADNFLKLRRSIDEHLELRRIHWHEFSMFVWLCLKASRARDVRRVGPLALRRSRPTASSSLRRFGEALRWYPIHRGARRPRRRR